MVKTNKLSIQKVAGWGKQQIQKHKKKENSKEKKHKPIKLTKMARDNKIYVGSLKKFIK